MSHTKPLVSILVPVYNAAATLPLCLDSLFGQTYESLELVFVDDCSSDGSGDLILSYADTACRRDIAVRLVRQERNGGVAAARNVALDTATGEYIVWVDADDWMEKTAVSQLVEQVVVNDAEIVGFDWYLTFDKNERLMAQRHFETPKDALENMMCGVMRWNLWLFMTKKSLYDDNSIRFVPGMNMGEDMLVTMSLFMKAERAAHISKPLYHYRHVNENAVSRTFTDRHIHEVTENVARVEEALQKSGYSQELSGNLDFLKQFLKLPLLMTDDASQYRRWSAWWPESDKSIMSNKMVPLRTRLVEYAASKRLYLLLKLYHIFVYKIVYGLIYR